jgi:hypothetical protein
MQCVKALPLITALTLVVLLASESPTYSQQQSVKQQLIGSWTFVVTAAHRKDGTKADVFGPNPNGVLIFNPDGHFALINTRPGRVKYASSNRLQGTPEEFRETVLGSIAYFGTYSVDETKNQFVLKVKGSTFPDYEGGEQVRWRSRTSSAATARHGAGPMPAMSASANSR